MNILVIGGSGFISSSLVAQLLRGNHQVTIFNRGISRPKISSDENLRQIHGDRNKKKDLLRLVQGKTYDVVYDFVSYQRDQARLSIEVFKGKTGRFIHCSTISVYMISEEVECPVTEDQDNGTIMNFFSRNPFGMDYGIKKRECEKALWEAHHDQSFPITVVRPTFVSGPGDPAQRDWFWIERILDDKPLLVPGSGDFAFQQVYVDDVANAFLQILESEISIGQVYNIAAEEIYSLNEYLRRLSALVGRNPELVHVDQTIFDKLSIGKSNRGDVFPFNTRRTAIFSLDKAKTDLNYSSTPFTQWMTKTIKWYSNQNMKHSIGYEDRPLELRFIKNWKKVTEKINNYLNI